MVNTHLYGLAPGAGASILPEHDVVVIDEAHELEDITRRASGSSSARRPLRQPGPDPPRRTRRPTLCRSGEAAARTRRARSRHVGRAAEGRPTRGSSTRCRSSPGRRRPACRAARHRRPDERRLAARAPAGREATGAETIERRAPGRPADVGRGSRAGARAGLGWRRSTWAAPCRAPWARDTAMLTSATILPSCRVRVGLGPARAARRPRRARRGQPVRLRGQRPPLLRGPPPRPARPGYEAAMHDELEALIGAAGGRTLALFTSWRAMHAARRGAAAGCRAGPRPGRPAQARAARARSPTTRPRACSPRWASGRASTSPARRSRWSPSTGSRSPAPTSRCCRPGASGPGRGLPPHRPTPGRDAARPGRRPAHPQRHRSRRRRRPRLRAWRRPRYRWDIVRALPPMRRTRDRDEVEAFLRSLRA